MDDTTAVERYLDALGTQDWDALAATIADEGLVRDGPFGDVVEGKAAYVAFLRATLATLAGYRLEVRRISHVDDRAFVELTETVELDGDPTSYAECILFERDAGGLIRHVSVYLKRPG